MKGINHKISDKTRVQTVIIKNKFRGYTPDPHYLGRINLPTPPRDSPTDEFQIKHWPLPVYIPGYATIYMYIYMYIYIYMCVCVSVCCVLCVYMYVYVCICMYI